MIARFITADGLECFAPVPNKKIPRISRLVLRTPKALTTENIGDSNVILNYREYELQGGSDATYKEVVK